MVLTNVFTSLGWKRDDLKWIVGVVAAIVVGLATLSDSAAAAFAIPASALPYIRLGAFIVGIVSANYKTSGLPGKAWLLPLLILTSVALSGCAGTMTKIVKSTTAAVNEVPHFQCGQPTAPAAPACLNPGQYAKVNDELRKVVRAEDAYVTVAAAAQAAKQQPPLSAFATLAAALSSALTNITDAFGGASSPVIVDLKAALGYAGKL